MMTWNLNKSSKAHFELKFPLMGRSPSVDDNTHIPEDRPRGLYILVSLTSFMSSLDHLRGFISASRDGFSSRAQIHLHHRTVEIRIGYRYVHYLVKDHGCHLTLAHW